MHNKPSNNFSSSGDVEDEENDMHLMVIFWEVMKIEDVKMVISQGYPRIVEKNAEIIIVDWLKEFYNLRHKFQVGLRKDFSVGLVRPVYYK